MQITIYGLPANVCRACKYTSVRMERYGLEAKKVMLDENPGAMDDIATLGYGVGTQAPIVVVSDDSGVIDHWNGFRDSKLEQLAQRAKVA